jgi:hypothetical protein
VQLKMLSRQGELTMLGMSHERSQPFEFSGMS